MVVLTRVKTGVLLIITPKSALVPTSSRVAIGAISQRIFELKTRCRDPASLWNPDHCRLRSVISWEWIASSVPVSRFHSERNCLKSVDRAAAGFFLEHHQSYSSEINGAIHNRSLVSGCCSTVSAWTNDWRNFILEAIRSHAVLQTRIASWLWTGSISCLGKLSSRVSLQGPCFNAFPFEALHIGWKLSRDNEANSSGRPVLWCVFLRGLHIEDPRQNYFPVPIIPFRKAFTTTAWIKSLCILQRGLYLFCFLMELLVKSA